MTEFSKRPDDFSDLKLENVQKQVDQPKTPDLEAFERFMRAMEPIQQKVVNLLQEKGNVLPDASNDPYYDNLPKNVSDEVSKRRVGLLKIVGKKDKETTINTKEKANIDAKLTQLGYKIHKGKGETMATLDGENVLSFAKKQMSKPSNQADRTILTKDSKGWCDADGNYVEDYELPLAA